MVDPADVARVVKALTEAQRQLVLWRQPDFRGVVLVHTRGIQHRAADVLRRLGVTHNHKLGWAELSPFGLAVRAALKQGEG
jgi:hypothetical protein